MLTAYDKPSPGRRMFKTDAISSMMHRAHELPDHVTSCIYTHTFSATPCVSRSAFSLAVFSWRNRSTSWITLDLRAKISAVSVSSRRPRPPADPPAPSPRSPVATAASFRCKDAARPDCALLSCPARNRSRSRDSTRRSRATRAIDSASALAVAVALVETAANEDRRFELSSSDFALAFWLTQEGERGQRNAGDRGEITGFGFM